MAKDDSGLSRKQEEAIVALLNQRTVDEAARVVDISSRTLYRWLKQPAFAAAYREARHEVYGQSIARLQQMSPAAVSTLAKIMVDPNAPAASRVRAADCVLERAGRATEFEDYEARLAIVEQSVLILKPDLK